MNSITFSCAEGSGARDTLEFIAKAAGSTPLTAALKHSVASFTVTETNFDACTFTLNSTSEGAARTMRRNIPRFAAALMEGYEEQIGITLEAVTVKH